MKQLGSRKKQNIGKEKTAGRLHIVMVALPNHKSFSEPLTRFTKQPCTDSSN